jgi:type IV secretion system protein TrbL
MLISFALIAALQVVALVESYIFTYAGILFLGFGGSRFTRDFAQRYLVGIVAVGAKLFVIQLIIGLAVVLVKQWDADIDANQTILDIGLVLRIAGGSIVFLALAKMIPSMVQGMINGASYSSATTMINATMAGANVGASAANGLGAIATAGLGGLSNLVGQQGLAQGLYNASGGMANRAGHHAGDAFSHSFDTHAGSLGQYMPGSFTPGKFEEIKPAFRGDESGKDVASNNRETRNTIGV